MLSVIDVSESVVLSAADCRLHLSRATNHLSIEAIYIYEKKNMASKMGGSFQDFVDGARREHSYWQGQ